MSDAIVKKLDAYFSLRREIHAAFGYKEDWTVLPLRNCTDHHWMLVDDVYLNLSENKFTTKSIISGDEQFSAWVYQNKFLPASVWHCGPYVMYSVDMRSDSNRFLMIMDTRKLCTDEKLVNLMRETWKDFVQ